jgi:hypothetical protein
VLWVIRVKENRNFFALAKRRGPGPAPASERDHAIAIDTKLDDREVASVMVAFEPDDMPGSGLPYALELQHSRRGISRYAEEHGTDNREDHAERLKLARHGGQYTTKGLSGTRLGWWPRSDQSLVLGVAQLPAIGNCESVDFGLVLTKGC